MRLQYLWIACSRIAGFLILMVAPAIARAADIDEIVRRGGETLEADWKAWPAYAYIERDETQKSGQISSRTSRVVTIAGSDYFLPIALDDKPLSAEQHKLEVEKLRTEVDRRNHESPADRADRIQRFRKQQDENGALILEFPRALTYTLTGEEEKNGHAAYVLSAMPKKRTGPLSRAAKVLSAMSGTVWVDREGFHIIRAECRVTAPVPVFGIFARVLPGTHVEMELQPVSDSVWLISRYTLTLTVSKLWHKSTQVTDSRYSDFRSNAAVLDELLSQAAKP